ncbi:MAG: hypothetical protein VKM97_06545 [Cyanobacteriota bacterium]|nr:hypothetical protein [Cyanobacteriota bacterium]
MLAALVPERRERLLAVGLHGGGSRVVCGVALPNRCGAGLRLGRAAAAPLVGVARWQSFQQDPVCRPSSGCCGSCPMPRCHCWCAEPRALSQVR